MRKWTQICIIGVIGIAFLFSGVSLAEAKTYRWKFISVAPEAIPTGKSLADAFRRVAERTDGKFKVKFVYIGQTPFKGNEALRVIRDGLTDGIDMLSGYCVGDSPYLGVAELPFLFPEYAQDYNAFYATADRVWDNPTMKAIMEKEWERFNGVSLGRFYWGINELSSREPITTPGDLKGLKIRDYSPEGADALDALGASATTLTASDVYPALQRGICDGIFSSLQTTLYAKWYEVLKSAYIMHFRCSSSHLVFNKAKYESLPPEYQKILKEELQAATDEIREFTIKDTKRIEKWLADELGWTVTYPTQEEYSQIRSLVKKEAWPKWLKRMGAKGKPALDACLKAAGDKEGI